MELRRQFACKLQSKLRSVRKIALKEHITIFVSQSTKVIVVKPLDYMVHQDGIEPPACYLRNSCSTNRAIGAAYISEQRLSSIPACQCTRRTQPVNTRLKPRCASMWTKSVTKYEQVSDDRRKTHATWRKNLFWT